MELWTARTDALNYLQNEHPSRLAVIERTFELCDDIADAFVTAPDTTPYPAICAIAMVKAKNCAHGVFSLMLDGLAQEAGALFRPMIEYVELLTYFRLFPHMAEGAMVGNLPSAGERAKAIGGIYKKLRDHLNEHASHSSFSDASVSHLIDPRDQMLRKRQHMVPRVLDRSLVDLAVHDHLLLREALLSLEAASSPEFPRLGERWERLKARMFDVFDLDRDFPQGSGA
jgi:hypothetical protein